MNYARMVPLASGFGTRFEVLRTAYDSQTFARHTHGTYTLGLILDGAATLWCRGSERRATMGDLVLIPPEEVHTGSVAPGARSVSYLAVYLPVELAILHAEAAGVRGGRPPEFGPVVIRDPAVRRAYLALDRTISSAAADLDAAAAEEAACLAVTALIHRHAQARARDEGSCRSCAIASEPHVVSVAREILEHCYARTGETSLQVLARKTGVNPFHLIRVFRQATGLAPHQYLIQVRVQRARELLAEGAAPSLAALQTGFVDQSHLTYHFRKRLGITPGSYRRCMAVG